MVKRHFPTEIQGPRVVLHKHQLAHAPLQFAAVDKDRDRLRRYLPWVDFTSSVGDEAAYLQQTHSQWDRFELYDYSLFRQDDEAYMGNIGVHNINWMAATCELGYWILGEYEGQGYMTEAARVLIQEAFDMGFHRIEIRCSASNTSSARIPRRLGFVEEARLREATLDQMQHQDLLIFGLLKREWSPERSW